MKPVEEESENDYSSLKKDRKNFSKQEKLKQ
jgi:hypothetical protein